MSTTQARARKAGGGESALAFTATIARDGAGTRGGLRASRRSSETHPRTHESGLLAQALDLAEPSARAARSWLHAERSGDGGTIPEGEGERGGVGADDILRIMEQPTNGYDRLLGDVIAVLEEHVHETCAMKSIPHLVAARKGIRTGELGETVEALALGIHALIGEASPDLTSKIQNALRASAP